mmetsp:Transcript_22937/g.36498  ORF Transcript_22937/g.36498 Transcript_22937/m.36498 type:complete len:217 (+) Transcript_22937:200-850(+)
MAMRKWPSFRCICGRVGVTSIAGASEVSLPFLPGALLHSSSALHNWRLWARAGQGGAKEQGDANEPMDGDGGSVRGGLGNGDGDGHGRGLGQVETEVAGDMTGDMDGDAGGGSANCSSPCCIFGFLDTFGGSPLQARVLFWGSSAGLPSCKEWESSVPANTKPFKKVNACGAEVKCDRTWASIWGCSTRRVGSMCRGPLYLHRGCMGTPRLSGGIM